MNNCTIRLLNDNLWNSKPAFDNDKLRMFAIVALCTKGYTTAAIIKTAKSGETACEEMFDLTNNPGRQTERLQRYGRGRSISSGDVITVDGLDYLCCSFGWILLD